MRAQNWQRPALKSYPCMRPVSSVSPGAVCKINVGIKTCVFATYLFVCSQVCCALVSFAPRQQTQRKHRRNLLRGFMSGTSLNIEVDDILEEEKLPEYVDDSLIAYLKRRGPSDIYYFIQFGSSTMAFKGLSINNLEKMLSFWYAFLQWRQAYEREIMGSV